MNEVRFSRQVKEVKFGAWTLDPRQQCIYDGCIQRELEPLLFRLLCYFIINNDQIITRQDLVDDVWCQKYVDDNAINRAMSELRKILKSDMQKGIVVKTHYRKGYSFFIEPEIIYHQDLDKESTSIPPPKPKSVVIESQERKKSNIKQFRPWAVFCVLALSVVSFYFLLSSKSIQSRTQVNSKNIEERVLSWVPGRYAVLNLSLDKKLLAFSFAPKDSSYYSLVVKELESGHERRLGAEGVDYYPLGWSTDSSVLYYRTKTTEKCQIWQISADFVSENKALFECDMIGFVHRGSGIGKDRIVYAKSGYRNRDELFALNSRNLKTGDEFQISSPNLNSFGDNFLTYIPQKEVILFERRQYDVNELYMTDPDGGNQVKLLESNSRIWALNYDAESDLLLWFDNIKNVVYGYSLSERKLVKEDKLNTSQSYAMFQFINKDEILILSYPFTSYVHSLDLSTKQMGIEIQLSNGSLSPIKFKDYYLVVTKQNENRVVTQIDKNGNSTVLDIPSGDIRAIKYESENNLLLVHYRNKLDIYKLETLSLIDSISSVGGIVSAEFLNGSEIGYVDLSDKKVKSNTYKYSLQSREVTPFPALSSLWFGRLDDDILMSLSSDDKVLLYNSLSGELLDEYKLPNARYKHSIAVGGGSIYHSDGEHIYRINRTGDDPLEEIFKIDSLQYAIKDIRYLESEGKLQLSVLEAAENQLINLSIQ
ncbi:hypothetical protein PA25_32180 [Pseudoalteromonas sp. A25]|uniref:winged helix-turn-helix domain-containing protein n=1 Tax=Pseudoalteromonas sp. A25 TaxID=116092 RepID=UPI0012604AA0|nr:winged helix-turn-helix domain-containing protein [Pseudoalteromonas sp. A25]BBN83233.1 hypothetical protein PA25_32180 [Pseudoalteromonas sp. A25]